MKLLLGDCLIKLKELEDNSIDAIVTDPPYGLSFMGKKWDYDVPSKEVWKECLRVLKPGGYLLSFAGTRTQHRMAVNIEDAGFEIRDMIAWVYGSGFPKSLNIGKAVDKIGGQSLSWFIDYILKVVDEKGISRKELTMLFPSKNGNPTGWLWNKQKTQGITLEQYHKIKEFLQLPFADITECEREIVGRGKAGLTAGTIANFSGEKEFDLTKGTSEWEGWGTALKPALEPITVARKPISEKTVAENCLKWGVGGINIEQSRIGIGEDKIKGGCKESDKGWNKLVNSNKEEATKNIYSTGRFPANLIHDGSEEVVGLFPQTKSGGSCKDSVRTQTDRSFLGTGFGGKEIQSNIAPSEGSAARFFYVAKASKRERNIGCEGLDDKVGGTNAKGYTGDGIHDTKPRVVVNKNNHPTVKPIALMEYLIKMVSREGQVVLDPFMGSGTTGMACKKLNRDFVGIEMMEEYMEIAKARINGVEGEEQLNML